MLDKDFAPSLAQNVFYFEGYMFERMLDKKNLPNVCEIEKYIGKRSTKYIKSMISNLKDHFNVIIEIKFPFGNKYGWGYKISNKSKHLLYIFFEKRAITVMIQIENIESDIGKLKYNELSTEGKEYWEKSYPCGIGGGWIHYRLLNDNNFDDIGKFIMMKTNREFEWVLYKRSKDRKIGKES
jgi:hypothetical protein